MPYAVVDKHAPLYLGNDDDQYGKVTTIFLLGLDMEALAAGKEVRVRSTELGGELSVRPHKEF